MAKFEVRLIANGESIERRVEAADMVEAVTDVLTDFKEDSRVTASRTWDVVIRQLDEKNPQGS